MSKPSQRKARKQLRKDQLRTKFFNDVAERSKAFQINLITAAVRQAIQDLSK